MRFVRNLRIWQKSLLPLVLLGVISGGIAASVSLTMTDIDASYRALINREAKSALSSERLGKSLLSASRIAWRAIGEPEAAVKQKAIAEFADAAKAFDERVASLSDSLRDPAQIARARDVGVRFRTVLDAARKAAEASAGGDQASAVRIMEQDFTPAFGSVDTELQALSKTLLDTLDRGSRDLADRTVATRNSMLAVIAVGLVLGLAIGVWLSVGGIIRPVGRLTAAMGRLADRDWTTEVPGVDTKDELGRMARAVEVFKVNGQEADRLAAAEAEERAARQQRAERLDTLSRQFETNVGQLVDVVSSAATEMQATAQSMTALSGETAQQTTSAAAAAGQASGNVQTVAVAAEQLAASVAEIARQVHESNRATGEAVEASHRTDNVVRALADGAQKIGAVISLINDIAGQTNLLALNATIEAARAGEAGKGFAVVASEVKGLAAQTARATEQISRQVTEMQAATQEAVSSIHAIGAKIGEVSSIATAIGAAIEEQGAATQEIARNVQQAAQGTHEVSATIGAITQGASNAGAAATQVLGAAGELSRQAERLSGEVGRFIADVKAA
jgi:methyl-accepting chemotaxis protein